MRVGGFAAPNERPSMKPSPKQLSIISTVSLPHACSTVAAATVAGWSVRTPSTSPMHDAYIRASDRASPIPFDDGSSAACSARVFHMSSYAKRSLGLENTSASNRSPPSCFSSAPRSCFGGTRRATRGSISSGRPIQKSRPSGVGDLVVEERAGRAAARRGG